MTMRGWIGTHRLLSAWLLLGAVAAVGWVAGSILVDRYVDGLDRVTVCANTGVALRDTTIIGAERARRDSAALADRNCAARIETARQGRWNRVMIPVGLLVALGVLLVSLVTVGWAVRRVWRRLRVFLTDR